MSCPFPSFNTLLSLFSLSFFPAPAAVAPPTLQPSLTASLVSFQFQAPAGPKAEFQHHGNGGHKPVEVRLQHHVPSAAFYRYNQTTGLSRIQDLSDSNPNRRVIGYWDSVLQLVTNGSLPTCGQSCGKFLKVNLLSQIYQEFAETLPTLPFTEVVLILSCTFEV